jgi:hypothetical protein
MDNYYPTDEQLEIIRTWDANDLHGLMQYIKSDVWHWPDYIFEREDGLWELHTGGWSGNESVIIALQDNQIFWTLYWLQSRTGGHYWFGENYDALTGGE